MKEHESHLSSRLGVHRRLCILQSRFVVGQLEKLRVKVSRAFTLVVEYELVITTVCTYHCIRDRKRERLNGACNDNFCLIRISLIHRIIRLPMMLLLS